MFYWFGRLLGCSLSSFENMLNINGINNLKYVLKRLPLQKIHVKEYREMYESSSEENTSMKGIRKLTTNASIESSTRFPAFGYATAVVAERETVDNKSHQEKIHTAIARLGVTKQYAYIDNVHSVKLKKGFCLDHALKIGKDDLSNEERRENANLFLKKYPEEEIVVGPFAVGGWFEHTATVESSVIQDQNVLKEHALKAVKLSLQAEMGSASFGVSVGTDLEQKENSTKILFSSTITKRYSAGKVKNLEELCQSLENPQNWTVFPAHDDPNLLTKITIVELFEKMQDCNELSERERKTLKVATKWLGTVLKEKREQKSTYKSGDIVKLSSNKMYIADPIESCISCFRKTYLKFDENAGLFYMYSDNKKNSTIKVGCRVFLKSCKSSNVLFKDEFGHVILAPATRMNSPARKNGLWTVDGCCRDGYVSFQANDGKYMCPDDMLVRCFEEDDENSRLWNIERI